MNVRFACNPIWRRERERRLNHPTFNTNSVSADHLVTVTDTGNNSSKVKLVNRLWDGPSFAFKYVCDGSAIKKK